MSEMTPEKEPVTVTVQNGGLRRKLLRSHLTVALFGLAILLCALGAAVLLRLRLTKLIKVSSPSAQAAGDLQRAVQHSVGALRGWVSMGDESFRIDRQRIWRDEIRPNLARLQSLSKESGREDDIQRLRSLEFTLENLAEWQWQVEDVCWTPGNRPARLLLDRQVGPIAESVGVALDAMIRLERHKDGGSQRKLLLWQLTAYRDALSRTLQAIDRLVEKGEQSQQSTVRARWGDSQELLAALADNKKLLGTEQKIRFQKLLRELRGFGPLIESLIATRLLADSDVARKRLSNKALPLAKEAERVLSEMSSEESERTRAAASSAIAVGDRGIGLLSILLLAMIAGAVVLAHKSAERIAGPLSILAEASDALAGDELQEDLPLVGGDELTLLTNSFNRMRNALRDRQEELHRSNEELERFAHVASHDLREPLRKVLMFGDRLVALTENKLDKRAADYLGRMTAAASRMQQLINDLLALARASSGSQKFTDVDMGKLVDEVVDDLETLITRVKGKVVLTNQLPRVEGDRTQLRQLLQNLIANALKFNREGTPPVVTLAAAPIGDGTRWLITVEDNGVGFTEDQSERIFEVFHRLHGVSDFEGTGMGLSICQKIVTRHGGTIKAVGRPDEGALFEVVLPLVQFKPKETE